MIFVCVDCREDGEGFCDFMIVLVEYSALSRFLVYTLKKNVMYIYKVTFVYRVVRYVFTASKVCWFPGKG